jgi:type II secretory ATPase GspE/PulE/Tfp pilus assembly ATPase PilB-like protein
MLRFKLKKRIVEVLATPSQVKSYIASLSAGVSQDRGRLLQGEGRELTTILDEMAVESSHEDEAADSAVGNVDSGVIKLCNQIILDGYRRGASDIHVEPNGKEADVTVRFRIDGECVVYQQLPATLRNTLVARIKIMSGLDISERRKPQDGKINFRLPNGKLELRVATLPTAGGEDAVLRILTSSKPPPLEEVGMSERDFREFRKLIRRPYGLMLCVGPTGSGKTTTLHSALRDINTQDLKIWTAEDPVEITQPGLRQVQMNAKIGLTFATILRAFLRADPDVIMVGEMRDQETAGIVVEASLTGHLVFSTLHTNNAPETISRLLDMGLDAFSFADALLGVLAQRLARRLCRCAEAYIATEEERAEIISLYGEEGFPHSNGSAKEIPLWRPKGCELCGHTGYKGRLSIHELLVASEPIKRAMQQKATAEDIRQLAIKEGMTTLLQDGIAKVLLGKTDLKQVLAVCRR